MSKNKEFRDEKDDSQEDSTSQQDNLNDDQTGDKDESEEPLFPFDKMIYQEKGENENEIHKYDMGSDQELNLGESESCTKKRTLRDEKGAGHEP